MNSELKKTYDHIAEDWHRDHQADDWWVEGTDKFIALLGSGARVLDVGCGGGTKSKYLLSHGCRVTGIDFSKKMIKIAARENPQGSFLVLDLDEVKRLQGTFDGIFAQAVLLHIPRREAAKKVSALAQKLKSGGYLYISVKEGRPSGAKEEVLVEHDYGYPYERFFSYFSQEELDAYLRGAGLSIVSASVTLSGNTRWVWAIGKK